MARMKTGKRKRITFEGGPFNRGSILMDDPASGTLTFTASGQKGRYGNYLGGSTIYWIESK